MSNEQPKVGTVGWFDLTAKDAEQLRDFYAEVVGWKHSGVDMGDYEDFNMLAPESGETVTGICHARGPNESMPPQWLLYINVADAEVSAAKCVANGGEVLVGPRDMGGYGTMYVIRDPSGAAVAILSPPKE